MRNRFSELIRSPYGIFLVTGPTGSGKTTTLYAVLQHIRSPDVLMVGEIRDIETAQVAVQASLTGHRVFSTLLGAMAQRLVRKLCADCRIRRPSVPGHPAEQQN